MYKYQELRETIFTEKGQERFLAIRDHVNMVIKTSGAITMGAAMNVVVGDSWENMACVDRMVELGELREIPQDKCTGQGRVFIKV